MRIWEKGTDRAPATLIIVQCKRERRKIEKVVLKALAADVKWNGAAKGPLVATTDWSPDARAVARTRAYPVEEVNGDAVTAWERAMRTAGAGTTLPHRPETPRPATPPGR
ncbi:restriction endonuclease [Streptomyces bauhiniae]